MDKIRHKQIMQFFDHWVEEEGLCRFCGIGRMCPWSRRGRVECSDYKFAREMDCFHLWIACFIGGYPKREGYDNPDSFPWSEEDEKEFPYRESENEKTPSIKTTIEMLQHQRGICYGKIDEIDKKIDEL